MKIIFLDIDGVMNNEIDYNEDEMKTPDDMISRRCVENLNELIENTGAKVVISSTWRHGRTVEQLQQILNKFGFVGEVIDKTPSLPGDYTVRGNEILKWMKDNKEIIGEYHSDFTKYVIFDDDSDMLYWQRNNFILVDSFCGLSRRNIYKAERILNVGVSA